MRVKGSKTRESRKRQYFPILRVYGKRERRGTRIKKRRSRVIVFAVVVSTAKSEKGGGGQETAVN